MDAGLEEGLFRTRSLLIAKESSRLRRWLVESEAGARPTAHSVSSLRRSFATRRGNRMALRPNWRHEDLRRSGEVAAGQSGRETEHRRTGLLEEWLKNCQYPAFPPALRTRPKLRRTMGCILD